jgi:hypothetical protein
MYLICAGLGFGIGFWAVFVTMGAEQFGTTLRATVATTVPNMVRGTLTFITMPLFQGLRSLTIVYTAGWITGLIAMAVGILAVMGTKETFGKDLNYVEE